MPEAGPANPNGTKTVLAKNVSNFFIKGKSAVINGLRKLRKPPYCLVTFLVVPFNKIHPFSKDLTTLMIFFVSLFARVLSEPLSFETPFLIVSLKPLNFPSKKRLFFVLEAPFLQINLLLI